MCWATPHTPAAAAAMGRWLRRRGSIATALVCLCLAVAWAQDAGRPVDRPLRQLHEESRVEKIKEEIAADQSELEHLEEAEGETELEGTGEKEPEAAEEEEGGEKKEEGEAEGEEEGEEEEEEEEEFTPLDLTCGICLLSFITFNMTLYYLVNWPDPEMRIYVWTVISTTISIFIAIFIFASTDLIILKYLGGPGSSPAWLALLGFSELTLWFAVMQVTVAKVSGALEEHPFTADTKIKEQKIERKISFKSIATLLAHITGFAAINAGGCLQHMSPFDTCVGMRFAVVPLMFVGQLIVGRLVRFIRLKVKSHIVEGRTQNQSYLFLKPVGEEENFNEEDLVKWCLTQWDEETYESEVDIAGLSISFLLVQAVRFEITGVMPNNLGIEEEHFLHPIEDTYKLFGTGLGFAALCILHVVARANLPAKIQPGTLMSTVKRIVCTGQAAFAMAFAWCVFTSSKWVITIMLPQFAPNGVVSRVLLAMEITTIVFFVILMLDKLADMESTGEVADSAIITIIGALSTLVGFSFEQSFDGAVEALADLAFKDHKVSAELVLALLVCIIVYPAWKKYILRTLVNLKEDYQNSFSNEAEKEAMNELM